MFHAALYSRSTLFLFSLSFSFSFFLFFFFLANIHVSARSEFSRGTFGEREGHTHIKLHNPCVSKNLVKRWIEFNNIDGLKCPSYDKTVTKIFDQVISVFLLTSFPFFTWFISRRVKCDLS